MPTIYTVTAAALRRYADDLERDAVCSLNAWVFLGQSERYSEAMAIVRALRSATDQRNLTIRREILRNAGFTVLTPKQARNSNL